MSSQPHSRFTPLSFAFPLIGSYLSFIFAPSSTHFAHRLSSPPSVFTTSLTYLLIPVFICISYPPTPSRPFITSFRLSLICHAHDYVSHPVISFPHRRLSSTHAGAQAKGVRFILGGNTRFARISDAFKSPIFV